MEEDKYPSELADRFMVRMPDGMRAKLADAAKRNNRSMNAEVVARLQASFEPAPDWQIDAINAAAARNIEAATTVIRAEYEQLMRDMREEVAAMTSRPKLKIDRAAPESPAVSAKRPSPKRAK
jgi:plasmid stability protein